MREEEQKEIETAARFIERIRKHVILKFDFDGVIVDSEKVAAAVTVRSVNKHLESHFGRGQFEPLTETYVFTNLSGLNFEKQQIPAIEELYGITFPEQLKADKKAGNLTALKEETDAIHGIAKFFKFIRSHKLNAIGVTQSDPDRVLGTLMSPLCAEVAPYITVDLEEGLRENCEKIVLLSAGNQIEWRGRVIEKLKSKPDPEGYDLAHELAGSRVPKLSDIPTIVFEDSMIGASAALAHMKLPHDKIAIVSLGGHVEHDPDHVKNMLNIIGAERVVVIDRSGGPAWNPWIPGALAALELAYAHSTGWAELSLPAWVKTYIEREMNAGY